MPAGTCLTANRSSRTSTRLHPAAPCKKTMTHLSVAEPLVIAALLGFSWVRVLYGLPSRSSLLHPLASVFGGSHSYYVVMVFGRQEDGGEVYFGFRALRIRLSVEQGICTRMSVPFPGPSHAAWLPEWYTSLRPTQLSRLSPLLKYDCRASGPTLQPRSRSHRL